MVLLSLSIRLVVRRERCDAPLSLSRVTVNVFSSPSCYVPPYFRHFVPTYLR